MLDWWTNGWTVTYHQMYDTGDTGNPHLTVFWSIWSWHLYIKFDWMIMHESRNTAALCRHEDQMGRYFNLKKAPWCMALLKEWRSLKQFDASRKPLARPNSIGNCINRSRGIIIVNLRPLFFLGRILRTVLMWKLSKLTSHRRKLDTLDV